MGTTMIATKIKLPSPEQLRHDERPERGSLEPMIEHRL